MSSCRDAQARRGLTTKDTKTTKMGLAPVGATLVANPYTTVSIEHRHRFAGKPAPTGGFLSLAPLRESLLRAEACLVVDALGARGGAAGIDALLEAELLVEELLPFHVPVVLGREGREVVAHQVGELAAIA